MFNFNDVETNKNFDSLPEDWYTLKVEKSELTDSKNGPKTMIKVQFGVISPAKYSKRKVWTNFNLIPKSLWVIKLALESGGIDPKSLGDLTEEQIAETLQDLVVDGYLEKGTTNTGNPTNNVSNYRRALAGTGTAPVAPSSSNSKEEMFS